MTRFTFVRTILTQALALTLLPSTGSAAGGNYEYLGEANVDGDHDHDTIKVNGNQGPFRRIQIHVQNATIYFDRVVVHFADGQAFPVRIASRIPAGAKTNEIDLPGDKRQIESVEFWYRRGSWGNGQKPKVRLMGIRW